MKRLTPFTVLFATLGLVLPLQAQDGNVSIGYFVTAEISHAPQLEQAMREHTEWHASQNDPWPGLVYQAMTGGVEYVWVGPGHTWADFDNPPVDPAQDMAHFARTAGPHVATVDVWIWSLWEDVSIPPPDDEMIPIYEVLEFDFMDTAEGREALTNALAKAKSAIESQGLPFQYGVNEVESSDGPPTVFVALAHRSFAEMDQADPNGFQQMLTQVYGHAEAVQIIRTFEKVLKPRSRRFWILRQDLSHIPGM